MARDPVGAVGAVIAAGLSIDRSDVPTPHLEALADVPREVRGQYEMAKAVQLSLERRAVRLVENAENIRRGQIAERDAAKAAERAAFVDRRIAELEAEWRKELLAGFARQAEAEARAMFDDPEEREEPPPLAAAAKAKPRKPTPTPTREGSVQ
ncbi:MAG TPA: hypothetical protein VHS09_07760 [Polyangiaceae bacterium]|nr:hypothetical protein [Polyangiaceae bacterium]